MHSNHTIAHRPLRGGIEVFNINPVVHGSGSLGMIARDIAGVGNDLWLVSCYHVLIGATARVPVDGEPIEQGGIAVASVDAARCHAPLDCAAAKLFAGVQGVGESLGIGAVRQPIAPQINMRLIKSGPETGVTEGEVFDIAGDFVRIRTPTEFHQQYEISCPGDSGSLWVERDTHAAVAMHLSSINNSMQQARATRIDAVLAALQLQIV